MNIDDFKIITYNSRQSYIFFNLSEEILNHFEKTNDCCVGNLKTGNVFFCRTFILLNSNMWFRGQGLDKYQFYCSNSKMFDNLLDFIKKIHSDNFNKELISLS